MKQLYGSVITNGNGLARCPNADAILESTGNRKGWGQGRGHIGELEASSSCRPKFATSLSSTVILKEKLYGNVESVDECGRNTVLA